MKLKKLAAYYQQVVVGQYNAAGFVRALDTKNLSKLDHLVDEGLGKKAANKLRDYPDTLDEYIDAHRGLKFDECVSRARAIMESEARLFSLCDLINQHAMRDLSDINPADIAVYNRLKVATKARMESFLHEADMLHRRAGMDDAPPSILKPITLERVYRDTLPEVERTRGMDELVADGQLQTSWRYLDLATVHLHVGELLASTRLVFLELYPEQLHKSGNKYVIDAINSEITLSQTMTMYARHACPDIMKATQATAMALRLN